MKPLTFDHLAQAERSAPSIQPDGRDLLDQTLHSQVSVASWNSQGQLDDLAALGRCLSVPAADASDER